MYFWHNLGTMHSVAYPELYKHPQSLLVYFSHNLGTRRALLRAIDRFALSTDGAALSTDLLFAQASIDRAGIDGSRCAIDRCTVGLCHGCRQATRRSFHPPRSAIRPIWLLPDINSHSLHVKSDARNFTIKQLFNNAYWTDWLLLPMSSVPIVV